MKKLSSWFCKLFFAFTLITATAQQSSAQAGTHLNFDGTNDYVSAGSIIPNASSYTKEAWVYNTTLTGARNILSSNSNPFWVSNGQLAAGNNGSFTVVQDAATLPLNIWVHAAVTYDVATTTMKLYKNGVLVATNTAAPAFIAEASFIGSHFGTSSYFQGNIDEVRIWNTAQSAADILRRMNCELQGNEPGLIAYYKFNQGVSGGNNTAITTLTNSVGGGTNGTLTNFTLTGAASNFLAGSPVTTGSAIPAAPTASAQSFCSGNNPTVANLVPAPLANRQWYNVATGGTALLTTTALATGTYYVDTTNAAGCKTARTAVSVTVNATPTAPTATTTIYYAQGATASPLTATGSNLLWYTVATGGTGSTTASTPSTATVGTTSYWVSQTVSGCESPRTKIDVIVALPATHLNFDGVNDAISLSATGFPLGNNARTIEAWIRTTQNNAGGAIMTYGNLSANNRFALYQSGGNLNFVAEGNDYNTGAAISNGSWHHIAATFDGINLRVYLDGVQAGTTQAKTFNTTGTQFSIGYRGVASEFFNGDIDEVRVWNFALSATEIVRTKNCELNGNETGLIAYYKFNQGLNTQPNAAVTTLTNAVSGGTNGTLSGFALSGAASNWLAGSPVTTGSIIPAAPTASAQSFCGSTTVANLVPALLANRQWYNVATGGTALAGTTAITASGTYYVDTTNAAGCSSNRTAVAVTINSIPAAPTASAQSFCGSTTVASLVPAPSATIKWYNVATGGTALVSTTAISASGTYYVSETSAAGCEGLRTSVAITINTIPAAPIASAQSFCGSTTIANLVPASSATIKWYNVATGGTALAGTTAITATGTYYVSQTSAAGCEGPRTSVAITINAIPAAPTASAQSFCGSTTVASLVPAPSATIRWYNVATGGTALLSTTAITTSGTYYAAAVNASGCESNRTSVAITINTVPAPAASDQSFCSGNNPTVAGLVPAPSATINWYNVSTGGTPLAGTTALATGIYYVSAISVGCESNRTPVQITVNTIPTTDPVSNQTVCNNSNTTAITFTGAVAGTNYAWTNNNTSIGLAASGTGNIPGFTATNAGTTAAIANLTVTPSFISPGGYSEGAVAFAPLPTTGTAVVLSDDEVSAALPIGFNFSFYGNTYSQFYISSNGFITFDAAAYNGCCQGQVLPDPASPNNLIAAVWTDLYPPGAGSITYYTTGTAPNRKLVVSYTNMPYCCDNIPAVTTQIILYEGSNISEVHTTQIAPTTRIITEGVENATGTQGTAVAGRNGVNFITNNDARRFTPTAAANCTGAATNFTITVNPGSGDAIATANTNQTLNVSGNTYFSNNCGNLIAAVNPNGTTPINATTTAKVWIESTQPAQYVKRHYEITPAAGATTATGRITLYFTQAEFNDFNAVSTIDLPTGTADALGKANLLIEKRNGVSSDGTGLPNTYTSTPVTINPADADIVWNATLSRWEVSFDVTGFSGFFVKTSSFILPLKLISFTGSKQNGYNQMQWQTTDEVNTKEFSLERSSDGNNFNSIATIAAAGTGNGNYRYNDNNSPAGKNYYRLKMIDIDGRFTYSNIINLSSEAAATVSIYPNPVTNTATLSFNDRSLKGTTAVITDMQGKIIKQLTLQNNFEIIDLTGSPSGMYIIKLANGSNYKLIKD